MNTVLYRLMINAWTGYTNIDPIPNVILAPVKPTKCHTAPSSDCGSALITVTIKSAYLFSKKSAFRSTTTGKIHEHKKPATAPGGGRAYRADRLRGGIHRASGG